MLGNLSKILIKAPIFFSYHQQNNQNNKKDSLHTKPEENIIDPFYQINHIKNRSNKKNNMYYFKEKDFWKKNLKLDMNFNHNKRNFYIFNLSPIEAKKAQYEQGLKVNVKEKNKDDFEKINYYRRRRHSVMSTNNPINTIGGEGEGEGQRHSEIYNKLFLLNKNNLQEESENTILSTETKNENVNNNMENNRYAINTEVPAKPKRKKRNSVVLMQRYNRSKDITSNNNNGDHNNNESMKEKKNIDNYKEKEKVMQKFPKNNKPYKSQEILFQENLDKKLISLILLKPQIKDQLRSINRSMVGQRDYYVYQQSGRFRSPNPFYESMKKREELNKLYK